MRRLHDILKDLCPVSLNPDMEASSEFPQAASAGIEGGGSGGAVEAELMLTGIETHARPAIVLQLDVCAFTELSQGACSLGFGGSEVGLSGFWGHPCACVCWDFGAYPLLPRYWLELIVRSELVLTPHPIHA
jgi:hypothetical protein